MKKRRASNPPTASALLGSRSPTMAQARRSLVPIKTAQDVYRQLAFLLGKADA